MKAVRRSRKTGIAKPQLVISRRAKGYIEYRLNTAAMRILFGDDWTITRERPKKVALACFSAENDDALFDLRLDRKGIMKLNKNDGTIIAAVPPLYLPTGAAQRRLTVRRHEDGGWLEVLPS